MTVVLICTFRPSSVAACQASSVQPKTPGTPRNRSWICAEPSRLSEIARAPACHSPARRPAVSVGVPDGETRDREPEPGALPDQVEQVRPLERVAAGEHEHRRRRAELGDLGHGSRASAAISSPG